MAKKIKQVDNGRMEFDHELDFDFDQFDVSDVTKNKKKRSPVHDVFRGAGQAVKSTAKSPSFWDSLARKALPKSYTVISDEVGKAHNSLADVFRESSRTLKPELSRIGRQVDQLVPEESKRLKKWSTKLKGREETSYQGPSREALEDQSITLAQTEIFDKIHQYSDAREARDRAEMRIRDKIDTKRFTTSINILAGMQSGIAQLAAYTTTVNAAYQKKSLELQFRSYHVQAELLRETTKNNALNRAYFEAIKENTALPDFAKITKTEMFKQQAMAKVFEGVQGSFAAGVQRLGRRVKGYAQEAAGRLSDVSQGLDVALMARDNARMAREFGMDESGYHQAGNIGGGVLIDWLAGKAAPHLAKLFPKNGKAAKLFSAGAKVMHDPSGLAKNLRNSRGLQSWMGAGGLKGAVGNLGYDALGDFIAPDRDLTLTRGREAGKLDIAHFDNKVHKSITDIIPGYLARILQETTSIRGGLGYQTGDMPTYDWKNSKFTTRKELGKKIKADLANMPGNQGLNWNLGETAKMITGQDNLQGPQAKRMKEFVHKLASRDKFEFTPQNVLQSREFQKLTPAEQAMIRQQLMTIDADSEKSEFFSEQLNKMRGDVNKQTNDTMTHLHSLLKDMNPEELESLGLTRENESGGQSINLKRVKTLQRRKGVHEKSEKPTEYTRPPPEDANQQHPYVGEIPNWTYDHDARRYNWTSDRNQKTNIRSATQKSILDRLTSLPVFNYKYRGKHEDGGQTHTGPMAQDVRKQFGDKAAPGGTSIDDRSMSAIQTEAIKELNSKVNNQLKDPSALSLLKSIDRRLAELTTVGKLQAGFSPTENRGLFGDTVGLATRYGKLIATEGTRGVKRGANFIADTGNFMRDGIAKPLANKAGELWDNNKDWLKETAGATMGKVLTGAGRLYDSGMNMITNVVPNSLRALSNTMGKAMDKTKEFLARPRDFYIPGIDSPVLVGEYFKKGLYVDSSGKPILDLDALKKVKGAIYKKTGEVVVTAEQMSEGLLDRYGNKLKNLATSFGGLAASAAGWAGGKLMEGIDRVKGALERHRQGKGMFSGIFSGLGFGKGGHIHETLEKMLKLMNKWDKEGFGGSGGGGGGGSSILSSVVSSSEPSPTPEAGQAPAGQSGNGFGAMGNIVDGAKSMFGAGKKFVQSDSFKSGLGKLKDSKGVKRVTGLGGKLQGWGNKLTTKFSTAGKIKRLGGAAVGGLGKAVQAAAATMHGPQGEQQQQDQQHSQDQQSAASPQPKAAPQILKILGPAKGKATWNDRDGSGRRDGAWQDRLEKMKEEDANRKTAENIRAPEGSRYSGGGIGGIMSMFSNLFGTLTGGVGNLFSLATSTLSSLGSVGGLLKGAGKLLGGAGKGAGKIAGLGGKMFGKIGAPLTRTVARLGATTAGRAVAGQVARMGVMAGAGAIATGGVGSAVLGTVSAGIAGLGAVLASPVVLGALATGAAAYGGYKLYKLFTRNKVDDFQKFRYMQYGFGSDQGDKYNHRLGALESYLLSGGRVGYKAQGMSMQRVAHLFENKIDPEEMMNTFDINVKDPEEVQMFTNWFQYRFKPFFLNTLTALFSVDPKMKLFEATKLKGAARTKYLEAVKFSNSPGYDYIQPPVKELGMLSSNRDEVISLIDSLIKGQGGEGKKEKGAEKPKSTLDRVKDAAKMAIPGIGVMSMAKNAWGKFTETKIGGQIKDEATKLAERAAKQATETGKSMLKYLKDRNIPTQFKNTILGLGSSALATFDKGGKLMKAAMLSLVANSAITKGVKAALNTKTGKAVTETAKKAFEGLKAGYENLKSGVTNAASYVADKARGAVTAAKEVYGKTVEATSQGIEKATNFISKNYDKALGFISSKYESGGRGVKTISTGAGDAGGVSYGRYQLASKNGSMGAFLSSPEGSKYVSHFQGTKIGSPAFNQKYAELATTDPEGFDKAQHDYIARTHYDKAREKLDAKVSGLNLAKRGRAVQEAVFSTSVQYGPGSSVMIDALKGKDVAKMTDEQVVAAIQDYKSQTVNSRFRSSSQAVRNSVANRIVNEKMDLIALARKEGGLPAAANDPTTAGQIGDKLALAAGSVKGAPAAANDSGAALKALTDKQGASVAPPSPDKALTTTVNAGLSQTLNGKNPLTNIAPPVGPAGQQTTTLTNAPLDAKSGQTTPAVNTPPIAATATSLAVNTTATSATGGDFSSELAARNNTPAVTPQKAISAATPTLSSSRVGSRRVDSGANALGEISEAAKSSLGIQQQQLDTMIEIREILKGIHEFVGSRTAQKSQAPAPASPPARSPKMEPMDPVVDMRRRRLGT